MLSNRYKIEAREKEVQGFAKIYKWEDLKQKLYEHPQIKLLPLTMIPHKSQKYWAVLDISFQMQITGYLLPLVNNVRHLYAPEEAIDQIGTLLLAHLTQGDVLFSKLDIKDGFWRML